MADGEAQSPDRGSGGGSDVALVHNVPQTFCTVIMTKHGQPPGYTPKRRRVVIRSDAIYLLSVPSAADAGSSSAGSVIKRAIPLSKIANMELRRGDTQVVFRVINEHDLFLSTDEEEVRSRLIDGLDQAMRANSIQINAKRKAAKTFDLARDGGKVVKLAKDLVSYPSMEDKIKLRCALVKRDTFPQPPYTLEVWDSTLKKLNRPPDFASRADHGIPPALFQFLDGVHVSLAAMVTLVSLPAPQVDEKGNRVDPPRPRPLDCLMVYTPSHVKFFTTKMPVQQQLMSIFDVAGVVLDFKQEQLIMTQHNGVRHEVQLTKQAFGPTFSTSNISVVARCFVCLLERAGYTARIVEVAPKTKSGGAASPTGGGKAVQFDGASEAPSSPPGSPSQLKPERSKSMALLNVSGLDEERLKKLVLDYKAPQGTINRRFMGPVTLLARQCYRLTSRMTWEPRVFVVTTSGVLLCSDDCSVRRAIDFDAIERVIVTKHWQCEALSLVLPKDFDCVIKAHEETPKQHKMADIAAVIAMRTPKVSVLQSVCGKDSAGLKKVVSEGRNLRKPEDFESPARKVERMKSQSPSRAGSMAGPSASNNSVSGSPSKAGKNDSVAAPPRDAAHPRASTLPPSEAAAKQSGSGGAAAASTPAADATPAPQAAPASAQNESKGTDLEDVPFTESQAFEEDGGRASGSEPLSPGGTTSMSASSPGNRSMADGNLGSFATHVRNTEAREAAAAAAASAEKQQHQQQQQQQEREQPSSDAQAKPAAVEATADVDPVPTEGEESTSRQLNLGGGDDATAKGTAASEPSAPAAASLSEPSAHTSASAKPAVAEPAKAGPAEESTAGNQPSTQQKQQQPEAPAAAASVDGAATEPTQEAAPQPSAEAPTQAAIAKTPNQQDQQQAPAHQPQLQQAESRAAAAAPASASSATPAAMVATAAATEPALPVEQVPADVHADDDELPCESPMAATPPAADIVASPRGATPVSPALQAQSSQPSEPPVTTVAEESTNATAAPAPTHVAEPTPTAVSSSAEQPTEPAAGTAASETKTGNSGAPKPETQEAQNEDVRAVPETKSQAAPDEPEPVAERAVAPTPTAAAGAASPAAASTKESRQHSDPAVENAASPQAVRPPVVVPKLAMGSLPRGGSGSPQVSARDGDWTPLRKTASIRVASWPVPSPRRPVAPATNGDATAEPAKPDAPLSAREGSVAVVEDKEAIAIVAAVRREGQLDDPAAVADPHPEPGRAWLSFRFRMPDGELATFYSDRAFIALLRKYAREHRKHYPIDGPNAAAPVTCVCAQGPAVFSFTLSFLLFALEQPEAVVRRSCILLKEPTEDEDPEAVLPASEIEWVEIPVPAFCALVRQGYGTKDIAMACIREVCGQLVEDDEENEGHAAAAAAAAADDDDGAASA